MKRKGNNCNDELGMHSFQFKRKQNEMLMLILLCSNHMVRICWLVVLLCYIRFLFNDSNATLKRHWRFPKVAQIYFSYRIFVFASRNHYVNFMIRSVKRIVYSLLVVGGNKDWRLMETGKKQLFQLDWSLRYATGNLCRWKIWLWVAKKHVWESNICCVF